MSPKMSSPLTPETHRKSNVQRVIAEEYIHYRERHTDCTPVDKHYLFGLKSSWIKDPKFQLKRALKIIDEYRGQSVCKNTIVSVL